MENIFNIENFNIIEDEENYYFFRSLEPGDIKDLNEYDVQEEKLEMIEYKESFFKKILKKIRTIFY